MSDLLEQAGRATDYQSSLDRSVSGAVKPIGQRWIRALDPRLRIVVVAAFAVTVVQLSSFLLLGVSLAFAFYLMMEARLPFLPTLKRVAMVDGFILFLLIMLPFTTPGPAMFYLFGFPASFTGLYEAIEVLLKANAIVMTTLAMLGTLEPVTLGHALARMRVPDSLVHLLLFTVRYIEVLHAEYGRLRTAMKCRGFQPTNSWHTYRSVGYLVGMLLIRSFERSERILQAMKCRGFQGQFHLLDNIAFGRRDFAFAFIAGFIMLTLLGLEIMHVGIA